MKRKHIDAARETRLWIGQIIVPTATAIVTVMSIPETRELVKLKASKCVTNIKTKMKRES